MDTSSAPSNSLEPLSAPDPAEAAAETNSSDLTAPEPVVDTVVDAPEGEVETDAEAIPEDHADVASEGEAAVPEEQADAAETGRLKRGEIVEGTVTQTSPTEILIALQDDLVGIISGRELSRMDRAALDELQIGRTVLVYVLNPSNRSGQIVLSITRALEEHDWRLAQEYVESKAVYIGKVSGYNKGGLIVRFGRVRGFVPSSQVSEERRQVAVGSSPMERWGAMVGQDIAVKVVEVDRPRNRLILSERAANKEVRDHRKAELLDQLQVGDERQGRVVSVTDFGAFVDLGGADGLIHLTELSWKHVNRPEEVVQIGQEVRVKVISLDRERRRIGLSMKSQEQDPWNRVIATLQIGQLVRGRITKLTKFGAFACLDDAPEVEGLIHISELADRRVTHPREVVSEGDELTLRIVKIDRDQRRLGLSLKQVDAKEYLEIDLAAYDANQRLVVDDLQDEEKAGEGEPDAPADEE